MEDEGGKMNATLLLPSSVASITNLLELALAGG